MEVLFSSFKVFLLNVKRNFLSYFLSTLGLVVGVTGFIFFMAYASYELSYDKYHDNYKQLYRVNQDRIQQNSTVEKLPVTSSLIGPELQEAFPDVINNVRYYKLVSTSIGVEPNIFNGLIIYAADNSSIELLTPKIIKGDNKNPLDKPNTVVLSNSVAKKLFGNTNPIGKIVTVSNVYMDYNCEVTGIMKDSPKNTHMPVDVLVSMKTIQENYKYNNNNLFYIHELFNTYVLLNNNASAERLENKLNKFVQENSSLAKWKKNDRTYKLSLERVDRIYLHSEYQYSTKKGNYRNVLILIVLSLGILLIAVINYINFSNTKLMVRVKEKNLRILFGSENRKFLIQFLSENTAIVLLVIMFSIIISSLCFSWYNSFQHAKFLIFSTKILLIYIGVFITLVTIFTFANYSIFLSIKDVSKITRTKYVANSKLTKFFQKLMMVFQYSISILAVFCAICFFVQVRYVFNTDLGMDIDKVLYTNAPIIEGNTISKMNVLKQNLLKHEQIKGVAFSRNMIGQEVRNYTYFPIDNSTSHDNLFKVKELGVCEGYIPTFDLHLLSGINFIDYHRGGSMELIINELACSKLGFDNPADAVGNIINIGYGDYKIIGVVNNYYHEFLNEDIRPTALYNSMHKLPKWMSIKYDNASASSAAEIIKSEWQKLYPISMLNLGLISDYQRELSINEIEFSYFAIISSIIIVFLSALGTFAISSSECLKRRKQMAVRKVLGSSNLNIFYLLINKYLVYLSIASIVGISIGFYYVNLWLQSFSKHVDITSKYGMLTIFLMLISVMGIVVYNVMLLNSSNQADMLNEAE